MFEVRIQTSYAAFLDECSQADEPQLDPYGCEVRRLLREIQEKLETGFTSGILMDLNGNKVGEWRYE